MRVAVVAGPDPGHVIPAIALCLKFIAAGDEPVLFTGQQWLERATTAGITARRLPGLAARPGEDDADAGRRIHERAAYIATELLDDLAAAEPDMVVSDVITAGGGLAAEKLGLPWAELSPHPLYAPSKGLPPIGSGLAPGTGVRGHLRDTVMRTLTARSVRQGERQRRAAREGIGLPGTGPGPDVQLIATLPALEVPRPDWPTRAHVVGPLLWEPTDAVLDLPDGDEPLVMVAPSTAQTGADGMLEVAVDALADMGVRVAISMIAEPPAELPNRVVAGLGRQDVLLRDASAVVCGGGHGMLAKALLAGVPMVVVPGGGDQWELANRAVRQGCAELVRPLSAAAVRSAVERVLSDDSFRRAAEAAREGADQVADPVLLCREVA
ncbi:glycosyl transferase [Skermania sp. ID1734]|uniref:glycosyltransferase n=1 Tax=Skermania sp. ID1734 TaxID=2597516 RepID=UPI00117DDEA8|nr:nucleotide disphospho-sugar-binding domain-containing protein [Skermania sp. ID1734]TSD96075.1 glycosyl transferase [Skermania sp. ID1734]